MATSMDTEYLTVAEAASILKVDPSTIRRWIDGGTLRANRVGPRSIRVRRDDLMNVLGPVGRIETEQVIASLKEIRLTPEEKERALQALENTRRFAQELYEKRGRRLFSPSWEIINEMRDERTEDLP